MSKPTDVGSFWKARQPPALFPGLNQREQLIYDYAAERLGGVKPPTTHLLGVKYWDGTTPIPVIPPASLAAINAGGEQSYSIWSSNPSAPVGLAAGSVAELSMGSYFSLNWVAPAIQITGGNGGYYGLGNEPETTYSDNCDPVTFATQLQSYVGAIRAQDPAAKFVGPNLTSWTDDPGGGSLPWGSPKAWFAAMVSSYHTQFGVSPPYDRLGVHCYINDDGTTAFIGHVPFMQMLNSFSTDAVTYGYSPNVWMTEGAVFFTNQQTTQPLSPTQLDLVTQYATNQVNGPVERLYYFQGGPLGWQDGSYGARAPFDRNNSWAVTDVGVALAAVFA